MGLWPEELVLQLPQLSSRNHLSGDIVLEALSDCSILRFALREAARV